MHLEVHVLATWAHCSSILCSMKNFPGSLFLRSRSIIPVSPPFSQVSLCWISLDGNPSGASSRQGFEYKHLLHEGFQEAPVGGRWGEMRGRLEEPLKNVLGTRGMQPDQCKAYLRVTARGTRGSSTATGRCHRLRAALWGSEIPHLGPAVSGDRWKWLGASLQQCPPARVG